MVNLSKTSTIPTSIHVLTKCFDFLAMFCFTRESIDLDYKSGKWWDGESVLPHMGYISMCGPDGYGFWSEIRL